MGAGWTGDPGRRILYLSIPHRRGVRVRAERAGLCRSSGTSKSSWWTAKVARARARRPRWKIALQQPRLRHVHLWRASCDGHSTRAVRITRLRWTTRRCSACSERTVIRLDLFSLRALNIRFRTGHATLSGRCRDAEHVRDSILGTALPQERFATSAVSQRRHHRAMGASTCSASAARLTSMPRVLGVYGP
jgi:hypothetical protein